MKVPLAGAGVLTARLHRGVGDAGEGVEVFRDARTSGSVILAHRRLESDLARDVLYGLKCGYPMCCVAQYINDQVVGLLAGQMRRQARATLTGVYVPCWDCYDAPSGRRRS